MNHIYNALIFIVVVEEEEERNDYFIFFLLFISEEEEYIYENRQPNFHFLSIDEALRFTAGEENFSGKHPKTTRTI